MTQLIGAICEDGKKVIALSDRMVSTGDMTLAFEHPHMKARPITNKAIVLTAGTVHEPDMIRLAKDRARGKDKILDIADILKELYQDFREKHVIDEVLRPQAGIKSFAEWHAKQRSLHDGIVMDLSHAISNFRLELSLLLAGVDDTGHLIRIGDPGTYRSYDTLAYCCIGMGDRHSENVFAWYKYSQALPLTEALYIAFEGKKRAEMAGGVGQTTDIIVIDAKGIQQIKADTIKVLEEIYCERESRSERAGFDKSIKELKVQTGSLENSPD
jgi:hypothetical protein